MKESSLPVVLVDDEEDILFGASYLLNSHGVKPVVSLSDGRKLLPYLQSEKAGVIVLDLFMPYTSGIELLPRVVQNHPEVPVVVLTASQEVEIAVSCMKEGAFDYLVKPVEESRFVSCVQRALEIRGLRREIGSLRHSLIAQSVECPECFSHILTCQHDMQVLFKYIEAIADTGEPVIISGESGTGKELIAQALHRVSGRSGEMVSLNVAGLDDNMFSDTLFGHVKGAFTSADRDRKGMIASAAGGTLFLDEIGDLNMASQVKLLRLLQDKSYYPLGSDVIHHSDARIVAATNQNLHEKMMQGNFRQDLFFRLSCHPINVPPLRKRPNDLPLLLRHFIEEASGSMSKPAPAIPDELLTLLSVYDFPGNIRELRSLVFNAVAQHRSGAVLSMQSFRDVVRKGHRASAFEHKCTDAVAGSSLAISGRFPTLKEANRFLVEEAMRKATNNQGVAATLLGITRQSLNRRLKNKDEQ
ncbi:MAG: sigma-54-dependent Fis family transcriptional regulator [Chromatiaceae bacterium]|nr:sigma-54-dependent Fis family transcriptional regulator [Gammaproteobacteria bacterium]MCP5303775.1 sigma-54-dependent Fis family transcriptional regulator [Pseudomonadales bacterium]MCP5447003.1 sigma-54-dependent Fis family transcriptional regulator [Chromatiaceae bacterium]